MASAAARRIPRPVPKAAPSVPPPPQSDIRELAPAPANDATQELDANLIEEAYELVSRGTPRTVPPPLPAPRESEPSSSHVALVTARSAIVTTAFTLFYFARSLAGRIGRVLASEWQEARRRASQHHPGTR